MVKPVQTRLTDTDTTASVSDLERLARLNAEMSDLSIDEDMFAQIIDGLPTGLVIINRSQAIVLVNREIEFMFGYPRSTLLGLPIHSLLDPAIAAKHSEHIRRFFAHPVVRPMNSDRILQGLTSEGDTISVQISIGPIVSPRKGIQAMAVIRRAGSDDAG